MSERSETHPPVCWETLPTTPCEQSPFLSSSWVRKRKVDLGRDPFNQNSNRSDREKWSTSKGGPVISKLFRLDRTDPLSFGPKFSEILVEWIAPLVFFRQTGFFECACLLNKPMVITEPAVLSTRPLGLGWKQYPSTKQRPYSIHAESSSSTPKSRKRKEGSAGRVIR